MALAEWYSYLKYWTCGKFWMIQVLSFSGGTRWSSSCLGEAGTTSQAIIDLHINIIQYGFNLIIYYQNQIKHEISWRLIKVSLHVTQTNPTISLTQKASYDTQNLPPPLPKTHAKNKA